VRKTIKDLFIHPKTSIQEAMRIITKAASLRLPVGIVLVVDKQEKLIGVVTDGDIRKALVKGISLNDPVKSIMTIDPITVDDELSSDEMIATMMQEVKKSRRISDFKVDKVIITNKKREVVDVADFYELWYRQEEKYKNICVVGAGHVGLTLLVVLAESGYSVTGFDRNLSLIERLKKGKTDFYEKGVDPLLNFNLKEGNLAFVNKLTDPNADAYIICVGTPVHEKTKKPVFNSLKKAAEDIGKVLKKEDVVILRSTVPVGTTSETVIPILEKRSSLKAGKDFHVAFAPERAVEGRAIEEIKEIPQVIGGINKKSIEIATRIFQKICPAIVIVDSLEEAEMVKLINNSFRDFSFSFANKIAQISEGLKLDPVKIIKASKEGYPRDPVPLPSPGVGGYCLTKDPYLMGEVAYKAGISADIFLEGRKINEAMPQLIAKKVFHFVNRYWKDEANLKIFILGFAFKGYPETSDMRGSTTLDILDILKKRLKKETHFAGYDPAIKKKDIEKLSIDFLPYKQGFKDAHCVLILNNNPDFAEIDIFYLLNLMKKPRLFFDGWSFFQPQEIKKINNIIYEGLGSGY